MKLYEVANEYAQIENSSFDAQTISDTLDGIGGEIGEKIENLLAIIKNLSAHSDALKAESKNLAERARVADNKIASIKGYIIASMGVMNKTKLNAGIHSLTVCKGRESIDVIDESLVPEQFIRFKVSQEIDKNLVKEKIKLGEEIEGIRIKVGKPTLLIK